MKLENVSLSFGEKNVLRDFSLSLSPGSVHCLMGRSGCGKSSVLNLILGSIRPDEGIVEGFDNLRKGVVFQEDRLIEHMDAWENVLLVAARGADRAKVTRAFDEVLLEPGRVSVSRLSGGQRRRVAVVRAMLAKPRLLLLDEPFAGLDPHTLSYTADFVRRHTDGATVLICSHERESALLIGAERFIFMDEAQPGTADCANASENRNV